MPNKVELIGHYGNDLTHAQSAWCSTSRELTEEKKGRIDKLLNMLAQSDPPHTSPFEKSFLHFLVEVETASHIHLIKHRIAVSVNGESARYKQIETRHYVPEDWPEEWANKLDEEAKLAETNYYDCLDSLVDEYGFDRKRAKESARYFLTYANQLTLDVSFNFNSFMHFQKLRNDDHAQDEIRWVADETLRLVRETGDFDLSLAAWGY